MKRLAQWVELVIVLLVAGAWAFAAANRPGLVTNREELFAPGQVLVRFADSPGAGSAVAQQLHQKVGATVLHEYKIVPNLVLVSLPPDVSIAEAIWVYRSSPYVLYAEPNWKYYAVDTVPNDPDYEKLWAMPVISAPRAWDLETGSHNVVVFVIDTGGDYNHEDLADNTWEGLGYNAIKDNYDPWDDHGHGTHVAGTIGAVGNNAVGVTGVNWKVKIGYAKFLNEYGWGELSDAIKCLEYVLDLKVNHGVNVIATNNSWGGGGYSQALLDAIAAHREAGILFIAAAGNAASDMDMIPFYPAAYRDPGIIAVASTDETDSLSWFSNYGRRTVHIAAPGSAIYSTLPNNQYGAFSGTSMAAPHVTGVVALLAAQDPTLSWWELRNRVLAGGDVIPATQNTTITGRRLNAYGALTCNGEVVQGVLHPKSSTLIAIPGEAILLEYLSIICAQPATDSIIVNVTGPETTTVTLLDDGKDPDLAAGDGIFAGYWIVPETEGTYTITFPNEQFTTVTVRRPLDLKAAMLWPTAGWYEQFEADHRLMDMLFGPGRWDFFWLPEGVGPFLSESGYDFIFLTVTDRGFGQLAAYLSLYKAEVEAFVARGGRLFLNCAPVLDAMDFDLGFGGVMLEYPWDEWLVWEASAADPNHPIFQGPALPMATEYWGEMGYGTLSGPLVPVLVGSPGTNKEGKVVLGERPFGSGMVLFGTLGLVVFQYPSQEAFNLRVNAGYYTATCVLTARYKLTVEVDPEGGGTVKLDPLPGGDGKYEYGTVVTLIPTPAKGYAFDKWTGPNASEVYQEQGAWKIRIDGDKSITANFRRVEFIYFEDFETSAPDWTKSGLWHICEETCGWCENAPLQGKYAHYAIPGQCSYDTGRRTLGYLTSPVITVPANTELVLMFDFARFVENNSRATRDRTYVQYRLGREVRGRISWSAWRTVWSRSSRNLSPECGTSGAIPIKTGRYTTLQIRFVFDSVNRYNNDFPGWAVDNVRILPRELLPAGIPLAEEYVEEFEPLDEEEPFFVLTVFPNPVTGRMVVFSVDGVEAEALQVEVYDLGGRLVYKAETLGGQLTWDTLDATGKPVANGVYLVLAKVKVDGEWLAADLQKILILR